MDVEPGTIIGGKYRIERPLSRGGMGTVYEARHVQLHSLVAVKLMDPEHAALHDFRARFFREARTAAQLESPHVVGVKDFGFESDVPYIVMELLRGEDLGARLKRLRRLPLPDIAAIAAQAARALRLAHEAGLVHRDLKPSNLFLARVDDQEIVKILDFGIVKDTTGTLVGEATKTGELLGSPFYMSPEQARGDKDLDARSDLWSFGVILFRAVTGKLPFDGEVLGAVLSKILVDPIPRATSFVPDLPPAVDAFFAQALARDRTERFDRAPAMARAFAAAAGVELRPTLSDGVPTTRSGTVLGISAPSSGARGAYALPGGAVPDSGARASWPGDRASTGRELSPYGEGLQGTLTSTPEPAQPGTLTSATSVDRAFARPPRRGAGRWIAALAVLFAAGLGGAALVLRADLRAPFALRGDSATPPEAAATAPEPAADPSASPSPGAEPQASAEPSATVMAPTAAPATTAAPTATATAQPTATTTQATAKVAPPVHARTAPTRTAPPKGTTAPKGTAAAGRRTEVVDPWAK